jgi:hypothetical protein
LRVGIECCSVDVCSVEFLGLGGIGVERVVKGCGCEPGRRV